MIIRVYHSHRNSSLINNYYKTWPYIHTVQQTPTVPYILAIEWEHKPDEIKYRTDWAYAKKLEIKI